MSRVLIVLSAADKWTRADGSTYDSGVWAEEFVELDEALVAAGHQVDIATPGGVAPTIDARSLEPKIVGEENALRFDGYLAANRGRWGTPLVLAALGMGPYDAIVIPGGHGPVEDLYKDPDMGRLLVEADGDSKIIASVCHGPAAFLAAKDGEGRWPFAGRRMTSFSDEEEVEFGTAENAPWLLGDSLRKLGAVYEKGPNWGAFTVEDGNLLTGQNPASTAMLAKAVVEALA